MGKKAVHHTEADIYDALGDDIPIYDEEFEAQQDEEGEELDEDEKYMPKWLRYARVRPRKFWNRPFLGGDETAKGSFSFVLDTLYVKGTILRRCTLPALTSLVMTVIVIAAQTNAGRFFNFPGEFFLPFFMVTLFVTGFRLYAAWYSYRIGHEKVLEIGSSAVDALLTCTTCPHVRNSGLDMLELIRRINVLLGFIRQDLRESRHHFVDRATFKAGWRKGTLAMEWFNSHELKFAADPYGSPPLKLLLTPAEVDVYKNLDPQDRVMVSVIAVRSLFARHVHYGAQKMSTPDAKIFQHNVEKIIHSWAKCREIVKTPPPFVLHHFGLVLSAMFCFLFCPLYFVAALPGWFPILSSACMSLAIYGIEEAACEMEVPFGWRATDCNLSKMCRTMLKRSITFCKICKIDFKELAEKAAAEAENNQNSKENFGRQELDDGEESSNKPTEVPPVSPTNGGLTQRKPLPPINR